MSSTSGKEYNKKILLFAVWKELDIMFWILSDIPDFCCFDFDHCSINLSPLYTESIAMQVAL